MSEQEDFGPLFRQPKNLEAIPPEPAFKMRSHRKAAADWLKKYPKAARLFLQFARQMAGRKRRFGVKFIAERVRWEMAIKYDEDFKINNSHVAYIARWMIAQDFTLEKWMEFRKVRS